MNRFSLLLGAAMLVAGSGAAWWKLREHHEHSAAELAAAQAKRAETEQLRAETKRLRQLEAVSRANERAANSALVAEITTVRRKVGELEAKAQRDHDDSYATAKAQIDALQQNRDLSKGAVLIENCSNKGRASPEATIETLVWASAHGHEDIVRSAVKFNAAGRAAAEAAIGSLPESVKVAYPDPEALGALFVDHTVNDLTAIRIVGRDQPEPDTTVLALAGVQKTIGNVTLKQDPDGWRLTIGAGGFAQIRRVLLSGQKR